MNIAHMEIEYSNDKRTSNPLCSTIDLLLFAIHTSQAPIPKDTDTSYGDSPKVPEALYQADKALSSAREKRRRVDTYLANTIKFILFFRKARCTNAFF